MGLFITRYITTLLIFAIGLKAPGISNMRSHNADTEPLTNNQDVRKYHLEMFVLVNIKYYRKIVPPSGMAGEN